MWNFYFIYLCVIVAPHKGQCVETKRDKPDIVPFCLRVFFHNLPHTNYHYIPSCTDTYRQTDSLSLSPHSLTPSFSFSCSLALCGKPGVTARTLSPRKATRPSAEVTSQHSRRAADTHLREAETGRVTEQTPLHPGSWLTEMLLQGGWGCVS